MVIALVVALPAVVSLTARAFSPTPAGSTDVQGGVGAMLGAYVRSSPTHSRADQQASLERFERTVGRGLAIDHFYLPWASGTSALTWRGSWDLDNDRIPMVTFGAGGDTRQVARGDHDAYLSSLAAAVRSLKGPVFLRYAPTPDVAASASWVHSGSDYVAAWRHVRQVFAGAEATWVWSPSADAFAGARGGVEQYWPGARWVDWVAAEGFNRYACKGTLGTWRELGDIFRNFYAWGSAKGKPLMVASTGTTEDPADTGRKGRWFNNALRILRTSMPNIKALVYAESSATCDWRVGTSSASLREFVRLAGDPWFHLPASTLVPSSTPPTTAPTTTRPATTTTRPATTTTRTTAPPTSSLSSGGVGSKLVPRAGVLWGSSNVTDDLEAKLGRHLDISHTYHDWDDHFPNAAEQARAARGNILFLDWTPRIFGTDKIIPWTSVANGSQDAVIDAEANQLKAFGRPVFLSFHHEPEDEVGRYGSASDFAAAFRHVHDRFVARGASNVVWVWNVMGWSGGYSQYTGGLYPGDAYVDWIAWDPYNWYGCRGTTWTWFGDKVGVFYGWLESHGFGDKPFMLGEYGTPERSGDPEAKAAWFKAIPSQLQTRLTNLKALTYFHHPGNIGCDWRIDTSSASLQAFAQVGQTSLMQTR